MRQPAGICWTEIRMRIADAAQAAGQPGAAPVDPARMFLWLSLASGLEIEWPEAIAFERELFGEATPP